MMHPAAKLTLIVLATIVFTNAWMLATRGKSTAAAAPNAPAAEAVTPPPSKAYQPLGVGSCAAASCHGGPRAGDRPASSYAYTIWSVEDRHAQAYQVLFSPRSISMAKQLGPKTMGNKPPHESRLCLNCHATVDPTNDKTPPPNLLADGVGCESCHGESAAWRDRHYSPEWKSLSLANKEAMGFHDLKDMRLRAKSCVDCHVGAADRDVNHDLIAAGHPRLTFEFGTYHSHLPVHWDNVKDRADPEFEARAWAVGQAVAMEAAAKLLAARIAPGKNARPWPEFAEFDCFACHHQLQPESWRQRPSQRAAIGTPDWGSWQWPVAKVFAAQSAELLSTDTAALRTAMDQLSTTAQDSWTKSNRAEAASQATKVADLSHRWGEQLNKKIYSPSAVAALLDLAIKDETQLATNWDGATQVYLKAAALLESIRRQNGPDQPLSKEQSAALSALLKRLHFPDKLESPRDFSPKLFQADLEKLRQTIDKP